MRFTTKPNAVFVFIQLEVQSVQHVSIENQEKKNNNNKRRKKILTYTIYTIIGLRLCKRYIILSSLYFYSKRKKSVLLTYKPNRVEDP